MALQHAPQHLFLLRLGQPNQFHTAEFHSVKESYILLISHLTHSVAGQSSGNFARLTLKKLKFDLTLQQV